MPESSLSLSKLWAEPRSTRNQCPFACPCPLVQRLAGLPSSAFEASPPDGDAVAVQPVRESGPPGSGAAPVTVNWIQFRLAMPSAAVSAGGPRKTTYRLWTPLAPEIGAVRVVHDPQPPVFWTATLPASAPLGLPSRNSIVPPSDPLATRTATPVVASPKWT